MFKIILFIFLTVNFSQASNCMMDVPKPGKNEMKHEAKVKATDPYAYYHLQKPSNRKATAEYRCGCSGKTWKQDASKVHACPYCGPSMPDCGSLVRVLPKRGEKYSLEDYDLPNQICPVSAERIKNQKHYSMYEGKKIFFCCKKCKSKFDRKPSRYLKKLALKPEKFGFIKVGGDVEEIEPAKEMDHSSHDDHEGHDHHH